MRNILSLVALFVLTLALAGCGGSSGCGSLSSGSSSGSSSSTGSCSSSSSSSSSAAASVNVASSVASISTDGSTTATITVTVKDANNNALSGVAVTLSASAGTLTSSSTTTGSAGTVTATLSGAGVSAGTNITVTATAGSVSGKATVAVASTQQTITLLTSSPQLPSDNSTPVTITALVQGANSNVLTGVAVALTSDTGVITPKQTTVGAAANVAAGTTDANGEVQALLTTPGNAANRIITVTATAGSAIATVQVSVSGSTLVVSGPTSLVVGASGSYSVTLTDHGGNAIIGKAVALTSSKGNTLTPATVTTNDVGTATFTLTAVNSGSDTITGTWQGLAGSQTVSVSSENFSITAPTAGATIDVTTVSAPGAQPVTISWTNGGAGVNNGTVNLSTTRGVLSATSMGVTNGVLNSQVTIYSTTAGEAIISATAVDSNSVTQGNAQVTVNFLATVPNTISLQASPSAIPTLGTSTLTATVTDPVGNPVAGKTVNFTLTDTTGGSLSSASAVTTNAGTATITYNASTTSSAANGVAIEAAVQGYPSVTPARTTLTVGGQTVFLSLGTGNTIAPYPANATLTTQYDMPYSVQAVDASGHGVSNVTVTLSIQSVSYATGDYTWTSPAWTPVVMAPASSASSGYVAGIGGCAPTQVYEVNGQIQTGTPPSPLPANWVLTSIPGLVANTDVSSITTSSAGTGSFNIIYPKDHAAWVSVALTATATVNGSQNSTTATFWLPRLASDYTTQTIEPPGYISPYGESAVCY